MSAMLRAMEILFLYVFVRFYAFPVVDRCPEGSSLETVRLATGAGAPVARKKKAFDVFTEREI